jgi:hypothetical protein
MAVNLNAGALTANKPAVFEQCAKSRRNVSMLLLDLYQG